MATTPATCFSSLPCDVCRSVNLWCEWAQVFCERACPCASLAGIEECVLDYCRYRGVLPATHPLCGMHTYPCSISAPSPPPWSPPQLPPPSSPLPPAAPPPRLPPPALPALPSSPPASRPMVAWRGAHTRGPAACLWTLLLSPSRPRRERAGGPRLVSLLLPPTSPLPAAEGYDQDPLAVRRPKRTVPPQLCFILC